MENVNTLNIENTLTLIELFETPPEERDQDWLDEFLEVIPTASLCSLPTQIQQGADGFPYFYLCVPESESEFDAYSVVDALDYALNVGCGIAIFSDPNDLEKPEWVFTFGNLWALRQYGNFYGDPEIKIPNLKQERPSEEELKKPRQIQVQAPSDADLPLFARSAIAKFLSDTLGLKNPKVVSITDPLLNPSRAIVFSDLAPEKFEKEEHFVQLMNALRWFFPLTQGLLASVPQLATHSVPLLP